MTQAEVKVGYKPTNDVCLVYARPNRAKYAGWTDGWMVVGRPKLMKVETGSKVSQRTGKLWEDDGY